MARSSLKLLGGLLLGAVVLSAASPPAEARVFVRFGFGFPFFAPFFAAPYYPAPAYYPYYYPPSYAPPVPYAPPPAPAAYAPPPAAAAPTPLAPQAASGPCREFRTTQTLEGRSQTLVGRACRQSDGSWRIVP